MLLIIPYSNIEKGINDKYFIKLQYIYPIIQ